MVGTGSESKRAGPISGVPSEHGEIQMCPDASPNILFCALLQFESAPVTAARQFRLRIPRVHAKAQPGQSIAQRLHQRQQGVGLLHRFAARECDSFERALLMSRYDQSRHFTDTPFLA